MLLELRSESKRAFIKCIGITKQKQKQENDLKLYEVQVVWSMKIIFHLLPFYSLSLPLEHSLGLSLSLSLSLSLPSSLSLSLSFSFSFFVSSFLGLLVSFRWNKAKSKMMHQKVHFSLSYHTQFWLNYQSLFMPFCQSGCHFLAQHASWFSYWLQFLFFTRQCINISISFPCLLFPLFFFLLLLLWIRTLSAWLSIESYKKETQPQALFINYFKQYHL